MEKRQSIEGQSIFSYESKLTRGLESLYRLFSLNVLFIVTSLPIFTIGIAHISLYDSINKIKECPDSRPLAVFFQSMKTNWRQGLKIGIMEISVSFILLLNRMILNIQTGSFSFILKAFCYGSSLLMVITIWYLVPLSLRRNGKKLIILFRESFLIACIHLPWSFGLLFLSFIIVQLVQINVLMTLAMISVFIVLGFSVVTYIQSVIIESILNKELSE